MIEPLSPGMSTLLRELRLCAPHDLRRCRRRVRRLTRDLPAFDSIWLDALVQEGQLTPFQAEVLESPHADRLRVGPCVLVHKLGGGFSATTYLARAIDGGELCAIKLVPGDEESLREGFERLQKLTIGLRDFAHPSLVAPHAASWWNGQIAVVSRHVPGRTLRELLIRRGRYPAPVVWDIGRQLLEALAALHRQGFVHGGISLANVRLTAAGVAVLVDAGVQPALQPELTPHARLGPEKYDGIAPERIGTGRQATPSTDLYALGCLLWQLLAGRPPFPIGDPLGKLAAHQTKRIPDVRSIAPDTPAPLALSMLALTARQPQERPESAAELLAAWGNAQRPARLRLARFLAGFERPIGAPRTLRGAAASRWTWIAALLVITSGMALQLSRAGLSSALLAMFAAETGAEQRVDLSPSGNESTEPPAPPGIATQPIPAPDASGEIVLTAAGPYAARDISTVGALTLRGADGVQPVIVVEGQPLSLWGTDVRLQNVHVQFVPRDDAEAPPSLVLVRSQNLQVEGCSFRLHPHEIAGDERKPTAVAWKMLEAGDPTGGRVMFADATSLGPGGWLHVTGGLRELRFENCLKLGTGPWLNWLSRSARDPLPSLAFQSVTARQTGPLLRWHRPETPATTPLAIAADDCVLEMESRSALVEFAGALPGGIGVTAQIIGAGSLAPGEIQAAGRWVDGKVRFLPGETVEVEGIAGAAYSFRGPLSDRASDSALADSAGPRRDGRGAGVDAERVAQPPEGH